MLMLVLMLLVMLLVVVVVVIAPAGVVEGEGEPPRGAERDACVWYRSVSGSRARPASEAPRRHVSVARVVKLLYHTAYECLFPW